jgi:hypothetical protein
MLEDIKKVSFKSTSIHREVAPVKPYPRIDPNQPRQEGYSQQEPEKRPEDKGTRRRFTAMRDLIEELKEQAQISRVDFNTANQELIELGLTIAEEELLAQLLNLKVPLAGIENLIGQMREQSASPTLISGRNILPDSTLFPVFVADLAEYIMRFEHLQVAMGSQHNEVIDEINNTGRFVVEQTRLRLNFTRVAALPAIPGEPLNLTISIQVGAVEVDENGRRAIFYQRPDQSYGLYSDKLISLSI